jgi:ATP-dependent exoDNAse (exonuclease V) beta subunit
MGVADAVSADALLSQFAAVRGWLKERWPDAQILVEVPVTQVLGSGQVMSGRVDLLLKTKSGWILIDYKSGAQNSSQWDILAATYGGQLAAYGTAIETATSVSVRETWLVLPIAGTALRVKTAARETAGRVAEVA